MKFSKIIAALVLFGVLMSACGPKAVQPVSGLPAGTAGYPWWNDTVFYEIFVRSFSDSNGDGIGDFNGVTQKLDYLKGLGVTGLWLMPIQPSPTYHGYDVSDYYAVNPEYGTLADFKTLLAEARKRGMRVIIDLVLNHTSVENPWFEDARRGPDSPKRNWYIWSAEKPNFDGPLGTNAWYPSGDGSYYYAIFWSGMPDLNYAEPAVREEMKKVAAFWLTEVGVDGFRLDAVRYLVEENLFAAERKLADTDGNHTWFEEFRTAYKAAKPAALAVGEIWTSNITVSKYLTGDELDLAFNFDLSAAILKQVNAGLGSQLSDAIDSSYGRYPGGQGANFLTNHDQNRVMSQFLEDEGKARAAAAVLLTIPGVPFIYYGEEIGMTGMKPDELLRKPMQWSAEPEAGFTSGHAWESPASNYKERNVALMEADPNSLLAHYKALIHLRNQHAALRVGEYVQVEVDRKELVAFMRSTERESVLVLINLSDQAVADFSLELAAGTLPKGARGYSLYGDEKITAPEINPQGGFNGYAPVAGLSAYGTLIIQFVR